MKYKDFRLVSVTWGLGFLFKSIHPWRNSKSISLMHRITMIFGRKTHPRMQNPLQQYILSLSFTVSSCILGLEWNYWHLLTKHHLFKVIWEYRFLVKILFSFLNYTWVSFFIPEFWKVRFSSLNFEKVYFYTWILSFYKKVEGRNSCVKMNFFKV